MSAVLDTHTVLWYLENSKELGQTNPRLGHSNHLVMQQ
jgi:PIN domain nuclease of toxin-antitoxin system